MPDEVLQETGRARNIALCLPGSGQSLFMAAQPDHALIATAPAYRQRYNQPHQLPLVARPMPLDTAQLEKMRVSLTLLWHKRNSHNPKTVQLKDTIKVLYRDIS